MTLLEKVVIPNGTLTGVRTRALNYERIMQFDDKEFKQFYLELMTEYKTNDGWWSEGKMPHCVNCHRFIEGPEQLRRHYGRTLDADCFRKEWEKERGEHRGLDQQYWDRVAKLN